MNTTPSPAASASGAHPSSASSASRRPPRKSTLTQQQKNQKRQRATQDQLITLEMEFNKNPTPTAIVRERIAQEINMTERSVQIWFQNRRAKIKNIAKKSIESGEDCDGIPESMRRYLALQAMESGKSLGRELLARNGMAAYGNGMLLNTESSSAKVVIHHFACRSLSIGSWRRVGQSAMDLVIFYSPDKCCVTYYINNDSAGYKIEYPFAFIKNITLENPDPASNAEGASQKPGGLIVELTRPPHFFMDSSGGGGFYQCGDFTEDQQASQILVHHLGGHPKVLSGQLAKLISLESFQNRHNPFDANAALAVSAPVSPIGARPASQPNHLIHPHMGAFQEPPFPMGLHPGRGHKRQRSRSVPVAMDFSQMRQPMPSFLMHQQQLHQQRPPPPGPFGPPVPQHQQEIYAPMPQHHSGTGPIGPNLSIDTSAGYGMDFRQYPMSATTAPSPSDYGTPAFFTSGPPPEAITSNANPNFQPQFPVNYMSPMPDMHVTGPQSVSPMPIPHGDPVIANQSPPLTSMGRDSTEMYQMGPEHAIADDHMVLGDMYGKSTMTLPFRSPMEQEHEQNDAHMDMNNMVSFDTIDPSSLSQGHM
ncbi:hypothetical protein NA57DRAFT_30124 [Rhizodiscina lignyota]|uniref:Homeobox domain-containing protein n=1 Tax=Rhizodiscina lignyota TaxID=1504668 RepID=A0A9P4IT96_9PEZI|nr:hypothetical protein NA57DRAFT_30124 [Rhizodiscina lignyota]